MGERKLNPLLGHLAQLPQAEHLKATGIGEDGARPAHEIVQPAKRRHLRVTGPAASGGTCCRSSICVPTSESEAGVIPFTDPYVPARHEDGRLVQPHAP